MEKLLTKSDIAAMMGTSPNVAASLLREAGISPIDFGAGRGRGLRWLASAVQSALADMHDAAQPKKKTPTPHRVQSAKNWWNSPVSKIFDLTSASPRQ